MVSQGEPSLREVEGVGLSIDRYRVKSTMISGRMSATLPPVPADLPPSDFDDDPSQS